jgi:hypothetical protein
VRYLWKFGGDLILDYVGLLVLVEGLVELVWSFFWMEG